VLGEYLVGSVSQLLERARHLQGAISQQYPPEFWPLAQTCRNQINNLIAGFQALLNDPRFQKPDAQNIRLRAYTRLVDELDFIECVGFSALIRIHEDDKTMTWLVGEIAREINYPLVPPVVSCQSTFSSYFHAFPALNLLRVPLKEGWFLLHLPDLYHEVAHFILEEENNPRVDPFRKAHVTASNAATKHLAELLSRPSRGPEADQQKLLTWTASWMGAWSIEFFCDLFGTLAVGPAYGWAHLHLCAQRGGDPFLVESSPDSTHPADEARMTVILESLVLLGYGADAQSIEAKWQELNACAGHKTNADYQRCFPRSVLKQFATVALAGYQAMGCRLSARDSQCRIHDLLNGAWGEFWKSPTGFARWEQEARAKLLA
jgi:hypothetical protein